MTPAQRQTMTENFKTCPTCGQSIVRRNLLSREDLLGLLENGVPHREVYRTNNGRWFVTYGGGEANPHHVQQFVRDGIIRSVYSNCPTEAYHIGRTWDYKRTMEARKKWGKGARNYFVGDPPEPDENASGEA